MAHRAGRGPRPVDGGRGLANDAHLRDGHRQPRPHRRRRPEVYLTSQADNKLQTLADRCGRAGLRGHRAGARRDRPPAVRGRHDDAVDRLAPGVPRREQRRLRRPLRLEGQRGGDGRVRGTRPEQPAHRPARRARSSRAPRTRASPTSLERGVPRSWTSTSTACSTSSSSTAGSRCGCGATSATAPADEPTPMGHWLALRLVQPDDANRDAIGAWLEVRTGERIQRIELTVGGGHAGGQLGWTHVGLGSEDDAELVVTWPDGTTSEPLAADADTFVIVERGASRRADLDSRQRIADRCPDLASRASRRSSFPTSACRTPCRRSADGAYADRLARLRERAGARGFDRVVVYADREHSANLSYLTGFDPRFEEALLVVATDDSEIRRSSSATSAGARPAPRRCRCAAIGSRTSACRASRATGRSRCATSWMPRAFAPARGWGSSAGSRTTDPSDERPARLPRRRAACGCVGPGGAVENATELLIGAADGLRVINDADQLAQFEWASCQTSSGVRNLLRGLRPGMTEHEAVALLGWNGHAAVLPPHAHRRRARALRAAQPVATVRSSAATRSPPPSASGAP